MIYTVCFSFAERVLGTDNSAKFKLVKLVPPSVWEWRPNKQASGLLSQAAQRSVVRCSQHLHLYKNIISVI